MADGKRRALDLLTAGQGERVYLKEECCFYVSWSGQVSTSILKHPQIHGKDRPHWCWHSCQQMTMVVTIPSSTACHSSNVTFYSPPPGTTPSKPPCPICIF